MLNASKAIIAKMSMILSMAGAASALTVPWGGETHAADPNPPMRSVLVGTGRISPEFLTKKKAAGINAIVVPLDEVSKRRWNPMAEAVEKAGMALWPWIEVGATRQWPMPTPNGWRQSAGITTPGGGGLPAPRRLDAVKSSRHGRGFLSATLEPSTLIGCG